MRHGLVMGSVSASLIWVAAHEDRGWYHEASTAAFAPAGLAGGLAGGSGSRTGGAAGVVVR
jgi:hypothetical protein